jgi:dethiobiotin synthetase
MPVRLFITGTDTGVGKTEVGCALLSLMLDRGLLPFALKPYQSGGGDDARALWEAAGGWQRLETVCLHRLKTPLAPGIAARIERRRPSWAKATRAIEEFASMSGIIEGAGGLCVPLDPRHDVADLIRAYRLPVVVVARAGLGTINHTALTLDALEAMGASIAGVVLVRSSPGDDPSIPFNRPELERRFRERHFVGPVPYVIDPRERRQALKRALAPLVDAQGFFPSRTPRKSR